MMMKYAMDKLAANEFVAKISDENIASLTLFKTVFKLDVADHSDYFKETTLVRKASPELIQEVVALSGDVVRSDEGYLPHL